MSVAIVGYPGSGRTTLANALASVRGVRPARTLEEALQQADGPGPLIIDGVPGSLAELTRIDAGLHGGRVGHLLYLEVAPTVRRKRISRVSRASASAEPQADPQADLHQGKALEDLLHHLASTHRLTTIGAGVSRTAVLTAALDALRITIDHE